MPSKKKRFSRQYGGKVTNGEVTLDLLADRVKRHAEQGYSKAKWIEFCEIMLKAGFKVSLYEARKTFSKYVTVSDGRDEFKVRFSNHKPIKSRELHGDCDFFVGITHTGVRTTGDAIREIERAFGFDIRAIET